MKLFDWLFGRKKQPREYESKEEYKETSEIAEKATAREEKGTYVECH